ncbi:MAG TPA: hypothetical protein VJ044_09565, partial [Candidatus Hodarchaeales archaeon]|nr:hypothetical protein [Candidatus Hodarchaeales archaeon]
MSIVNFFDKFSSLQEIQETFTQSVVSAGVESFINDEIEEFNRKGRKLRAMVHEGHKREINVEVEFSEDQIELKCTCKRGVTPDAVCPHVIAVWMTYAEKAGKTIDWEAWIGDAYEDNSHSNPRIGRRRQNDLSELNSRSGPSNMNSNLPATRSIWPYLTYST